jgi:hypothetical protein
MNANESRAPKTILPVSRILPFLPFEDGLRVFEMPEVRFIGKSTIDTLKSEGNPIPAFWGKYFSKDYHLVTDTLPHVIPNRLAWFGDFSQETSQYTYMICVGCPTGTPVPDGFEYRDVAASFICHGATNENERDAYAEDRESEELQKLGFNLLGPMCEFYPDLENPSFCVLFSCTPIVK